MLSKIYNGTKTFLGKAMAVLAAIVVVMTFVDFLLKWQIYPYIFNGIIILLKIIYLFAFETLVLTWLTILSIIVWRLYKKFAASKSNALEKQILDIKTALEAQIKKSSDFVSTQVKSVETRLSEKTFEIERTLVDFEIENHRAKNQVGEVAMMIKKLNMDTKRKWGADNTLLEIKEYIKKSGMPNYFLEDLHDALRGVPDSLKIVSDEILRLAQEKLYNPR